MAHDALIDEIERTGEARGLLRSVRGETGLCAAYFGRLLEVFHADPSRAARLARHWRAFLDLGDDPALAYRAKGAADRLQGRWWQSAQAFLKAGELAGDERSRSSYSLGAVDALAKAGRVNEAVELGTRLARQLDRLGEPALAARARLNAANALVWADRGGEASALYRVSIPIFAREGMAMEEAAARLGLSSTQLYGGSPSVAGAEATAARALAEQAGLPHVVHLCDLNLAHLALVGGRADEAFATLLSLRPRLEGSPHDLARADASIGDACLRLNLRAEAVAAYEAALADRRALAATDRAHVLLGLGEARESEEAHRCLVQAARRYRSLGNHAWRSAALSARASLNPSHRDALRLADTAAELAQGSPYHDALAQLARAEALLARGRDPGDALRRAERIVRRCGYRRFAWRIHALRARAARNPLPHYRKMLAEILRERLATSSVAARAGFLSDKTEALGAYLALLLEKPTSRRVAEAREAIRRTRAVTLLDEIFNRGTLRLDPARARRLEELRAQVVRDAAEEPVPDARAAVLQTPERRSWTEATHVLGALDAALPSESAKGCVVLAEASGRLWALVDDRAIALRMNRRELEESLRWLRFELLAPTADREAPAAEALSLLAELRRALVEPWLGAVGAKPRLCPDGPLWQVPWDALIDAGTTLLLHPSLKGGQAVGELERVALWIDTPRDLPRAPEEERTLLAKFPHARVLRSRAEILGSFDERWDLVHVVGHARHNAGNPMFSSLEFADGPLYATEVARSGLRTRLACLSACETGTLSFVAQTEPDGLVRAFLARGTEAVLASLWPLDDESASRFFRTMYSDLRPCDDLALAVGGARRAVRSWRDHPYFWAALSLFGGYRK